MEINIVYVANGLKNWAIFRFVGQLNFRDILLPTIYILEGKIKSPTFKIAYEPSKDSWKGEAVGANRDGIM